MTTLREYRKSRGIPLEVVATEVGVSSASLSRIERGEQWPDKLILENIERYTDGEVTPNDFTARPSDPSRSSDGAAA